jgi:hypothetical protein
MRKSSNEAIDLVRESKQAIWKKLIASGAPMGGILLPKYRASVLGVGAAWVSNDSEAQNNIVPYNPTKVLANA